MANDGVTNQEVALLLEEIASLLEQQAANPFRVRAYRTGAATVRKQKKPVMTTIAEEGADALQELPGIGEGLAATIAEYVNTRRSRALERLQGEFAPADLLVRVPGIGEELAGRIVEKLGIETLEELERAAHDGRLATVEGFGPRRLETVRANLGSILSQATQRRIRQRATAGAAPTAPPSQPTIAQLLSVDEEYRRRAAADDLNKIAPRRFNPNREAWLPVLHTERDAWEFTAVFSNTARAHELNATRDWVVIYYRPEGKGQDDEGQNTVVTETGGSLLGKRVIRGREDECRRYYAEPAPAEQVEDDTTVPF
ncbi:MAG: DNA-binding protein [Caldilinea sp. CFX5]|nr:DNA-binding protein [Caldilinea sp. CFX5]